MNTPAHDRVNELLLAFGIARGMQNASLNDLGVLAFNYKGKLDIVVELAPSGEAVYFYSGLCSIPGHEREAFLENLLELNLLFGGTNGSTLAIDRKENRVILCYSLPVDQLDGVLLGNIIENFLETAVNLQDELQASLSGNGSFFGASQTPDSDLPFGMGIRI